MGCVLVWFGDWDDFGKFPDGWDGVFVECEIIEFGEVGLVRLGQDVSDGGC